MRKLQEGKAYFVLRRSWSHHSNHFRMPQQKYARSAAIGSTKAREATRGNSLLLKSLSSQKARLFSAAPRVRKSSMPSIVDA